MFLLKMIANKLMNGLMLLICILKMNMGTRRGFLADFNELKNDFTVKKD